MSSNISFQAVIMQASLVVDIPTQILPWEDPSTPSAHAIAKILTRKDVSDEVVLSCAYFGVCRLRITLSSPYEEYYHMHLNLSRVVTRPSLNIYHFHPAYISGAMVSPPSFHLSMIDRLTQNAPSFRCFALRDLPAYFPPSRC